MASTDYNQLTDSSDSDSADTNTIHRHVFPDLIQRLCPDLLAEIFTFCLPDVPKGSLLVERISSWKAPLLLCSVCSSWRSLAISTPRLWQTLHFDTISDEKSTIDTGSITSGIRTWLDRSRALPLSIRAIFWPEDLESDKATRCRLILDVLSQEISRWESFELHEDGIYVTPPHFGIMPMLHTFDISGSSIDGIPFTAAPRLKRLGLKMSPCPSLTSVSAIPWNKLVEFTIWNSQSISISLVVEVIQCCPQLESLWLRIDEGDDDSSPTFRSITQHDTLRRLHLDLLPHVNAVTDRLTLPALTDLSLRTYWLTPEIEAKFCCSQLVAFFARSNCKLQEFALHNPKFGPVELRECLSHQSCQTLTRLVIEGDESSPPMVDRELLIHMTYSDVDDDEPLCPKLRHLQLDFSYCSDRLFPDLLGRMVQSRCFGRTRDAQLRSLRILNRYPVSREDYELLQFAKSNGGLDLRYIYITYRAANDSNAITGTEMDEGGLSNVDD